MQLISCRLINTAHSLSVFLLRSSAFTDRVTFTGWSFGPLATITLQSLLILLSQLKENHQSMCFDISTVLGPFPELKGFVSPLKME